MNKTVMRLIQAATECSLVVVWGTAVLWSALVLWGPHARERFYANLLWALSNSTAFFFVGAVLWLAFWGLRSLNFPSALVRIIGLAAAPALSLVVARRSFFMLLNQPGYYYLGPMIFLFLFVFMGATYGTWRLPRLLSPNVTARLHIHWLVVLLMVPYVPILLYRSFSGYPQQVFATVHEKPSFEMVFVRWSPGRDGLAVEPFNMPLPAPRGGLIPEPDYGRADTINMLNEKELAMLRDAGVAGKLKVLGGSTASSHIGRLVLIISHQIDAPFEFAAPGDADVIYLQTAEGWQKLPADAGESSTRIRLYVPDDKADVTGVDFDRHDGHTYRDETRYRWEQNEPSPLQP